MFTHKVMIGSLINILWEETDPMEEKIKFGKDQDHILNEYSEKPETPPPGGAEQFASVF